MDANTVDQNPERGEFQGGDTTGSVLHCSYFYDPENAVVNVEIFGSYQTQIFEHVNDEGEVSYTSDAFRAPQKDLKSAMEWVARNVGTRAVGVAWEINNPKPEKIKVTRMSAKAAREAADAAYVSNLELANNALMAQLQAIAGDMQAIRDQMASLAEAPQSVSDPVVGTPGAPTGSASSGSHLTVVPGGTGKGTSRKVANA